MRYCNYVLASFLLTGCSSWNAPREERHKTEVTLHKVRTEVEDLKHDLNTSDIELHILEGKLLDQEETLAHLKDELLESQSSKLEELQQLILSYNKKIASLEKKQDEMLTDLRQLATHANETTTALSQYKDKLCEMEKSISFQNKKFDELAKIKKNLEALASETPTPPLHSYIIKEGDSLQKIAKQYNLSVEELKKLNHLKDDLIFSGQSILVPKNQAS